MPPTGSAPDSKTKSGSNDRGHRRPLALETSRSLGTPVEERFDRIVRLARRICDVPVASIELERTPAGSVFMSGTRGKRGRQLKFRKMLELRLHGQIVGKLRVGDYLPRTLDPSQKEMLQELAHLAEQQIEEGASQRELVEENEQLRTWAFVDALTLSWNRSAIREIAFREIDAARSRDKPVGLAMIDLDLFKRVNDSHGHDVGDAVLCEISARLRAAIRATDAVGRYGGEEFLVVMPECCLTAGVAAGERIRQAIAKPIHVEGFTLTVTASIGVAVHKGDDRTLDDTIREADRALYRAKARGRNCVAAAPSAHTGGRS